MQHATATFMPGYANSIWNYSSYQEGRVVEFVAIVGTIQQDATAITVKRGTTKTLQKNSRIEKSAKVSIVVFT